MTQRSSCSIHRINMELVVTCIVGLVLSYYAYSIEIIKEQDDSYEAMCDINEYMGCSKVFMSKYGKGFGLFRPDSLFYLPNPVYGLIFYSLMAILSICTINDYSATVAAVILAVISNISSIYLAYILYVIGNLCIVCVSMYVINAIMLILVMKKLSELKRQKVKTK